MERRLIPGHSPYEPIMGYSRAVVAGGHVFVAGTAPIPADGSAPPEDA
jgi:enamine deaminase RidA (YjgF/YER057c/UK114 family)